MNKRNISDILRQSIKEDNALTYEQKAEMWSNIERKVVSTRMPQRKSLSSGFTGFLAGAGTMAAIAFVVFFGGKYLIAHHTVTTTTASHPTPPATVTTAPAKNNSIAANTSNKSVPSSTSSVPSTSQNATSSTPSTPNSTSPSNVVVHSYASASQATSAIDAIQQGFGKIYPSGPNLNLGNGISAQEAGGLGSLFLKWTEGHWTILTYEASNIAIPQAKQMVAYLHTHMLPAPQNKGIIVVAQLSSPSTGTRQTNTTVAWQVGNKVYEIQQTGNPINALQAAVNHG